MKSQWAEEKRGGFEEEVQICLGDHGEGSGSGGSVDISGLIDRLQGFSKELGLMLEFLELNATAFSKIMKKVCSSSVICCCCLF